METPRSWLFAPGHNERHLSKVFDAGADVVLLDLEDAVPESLKESARALVAEAAKSRPCWVRVNRPGSETCVRDLEALAGSVSGFRVPKVESAEDVAWVAERDLAEVRRTFDAGGVLWGPYQTFKELMASEYVSPTDNPMLKEVGLPAVGRYLAAGSPLRFGAAITVPPMAAPTLGQHTGEIVREFGLDE